MRIFFGLLFFLISLNSVGQVSLLKSAHDFGELNRGDNRMVDFTIKNTGNSPATIFRLEAGNEFDIKFTSKTIEPGSEETIRVQFNPREKGKFNYKLPLYLSSWQKPGHIELSGEVMYVGFIDTPCPDFNSPVAPLEIDLFVKAFDAVTEEPVRAETKLVSRGRIVKEFRLNANGEHTEIVDPAFYLISVSANGYTSVDTAVYVNSRQKDFVFPLIPDESYDVIVSNSEPEELPEEEFAEVNDEEEELSLEMEDLNIPEEAIDENELYPDFPLSKYKPNNIVFLIDVSTSMRYRGRLDLLKFSMIQLLDMLRPIDKIAVVTYASDAKVILNSVAAMDKQTIEDMINSLEAKGSTAGGKGIDLAGDVTLEAFIANGNNEIILATDGAFNKESQNAERIVKKYRKQGVKLSVIGIKNSEFAKKQMREIAEVGEGNYLEINALEDAAELLKEEIKKMSRRN